MNTRSRARNDSIGQDQNQTNSLSNYQTSLEKTSRAHATLRKEKRIQQNLVTNRNVAINRLNSEFTHVSTSSDAYSESSSSLTSSSDERSRFSSQAMVVILDPREYMFEDAKTILDEMLREARSGKFPKKKFTNNGKEYEYTAYLNFTRSISLTNTEQKKIFFTCIFCGVKTKGHLGATSNTLSHLERHKNVPDLMEWLNLYKSDLGSSEMPIDEFSIKLVKYFIASNSAIAELDSQHFRNLFSDSKHKIPSSRTFKDKLLPEVFNLLNKRIACNCNRHVPNEWKPLR
ncbi:unnamed protein product [Brachionus calyciflorus]|uniref:Uncharacterized protein n=1 Tax=Brachionus calyciflorus TaxID=104777 RepID=A0A814H7V4_9BILA|nr:unnamed protein product [Brachionus calyciflorus]